jgi:hypothetical protein
LTIPDWDKGADIAGDRAPPASRSNAANRAAALLGASTPIAKLLLGFTDWLLLAGLRSAAWVCSDWLPRHKGERDAEADLAGGVVAGTRATQAEIDRHIVPYLPFRPPMSAERVAVAVKSRS